MCPLIAERHPGLLNILQDKLLVRKVLYYCLLSYEKVEPYLSEHYNLEHSDNTMMILSNGRARGAVFIHLDRP